MLRRTMLSLIMTGILMAGSNAVAENVLVLKIGPTWPKALKDSKKPTAWDASIQTGLIIDRKIAIGGGLDFLWNVNEKKQNVQENVYRREMIDRTFMFPLSAFLAITPLPDLKVTPCVSTQIGLNTMYFSHEENKTDEADPTPSLVPQNGWYMGFYWKIAADAIFNFGENSGIFAGLDFQYSNPKKLQKEHDDLYSTRNMRGIGIRMGIRLLY